MVLVFSSQANASKHVLREVERAVHHGIPIIPLRIEKVRPTKELEYFLSVKHWLEADTQPLDQHLERLAATAAAALTAANPPPNHGPNRRSNSRETASPPSRPTHSAPGPLEATRPPSQFPPRRAVLAGLGLLPVLGAGWWLGHRAGSRTAPPANPNQQPGSDLSVRNGEETQVASGRPGSVGEQQPGSSSKPIDLLTLIDDVRDAPYGWIIRRGKQLVIARGPAQKTGVALVIPWRPPAAYRLRLRIGRTPDTDGPIALGLASAGHLFAIVMDHGADGSRRTGLAAPNRELQSAVRTGGLLIKKTGLVDLVVTVESHRVELGVLAPPGPDAAGPRADQLSPLLSHRGDVSALYDGMEARRGAEMILASSHGMVLEQLVLEPLTGDPGRPLRTPESSDPNPR
jgi:hypothetical protein